MLLQRDSVGSEDRGRQAPSAVTVIPFTGLMASRHRVEDFFEDGKSYLGMVQYETRSWVGWHHHMTLVGLAHLFVTQT